MAPICTITYIVRPEGSHTWGLNWLRDGGEGMTESARRQRDCAVAGSVATLPSALVLERVFGGWQPSSVVLA
ncbi:hypothetical protein [Mycobacterium sp. MMS18-G62]